MQEKSWEIKEIPTWVSQKEASALSNILLMRIERRTMANIQVRVDDALRDEAVAVLNRLVIACK